MYTFASQVELAAVMQVVPSLQLSRNTHKSTEACMGIVCRTYPLVRILWQSRSDSNIPKTTQSNLEQSQVKYADWMSRHPLPCTADYERASEVAVEPLTEIPFKYHSYTIYTIEWYLNGPRRYYGQGYLNGI